MAFYVNEKPAWSLAAIVAGMAAALTGCNSSGDDGSGTATENTLSFAEVPVPTSDAERRAVVGSPTATVNGKDYSIGYHTILRSGESYSTPARGATSATELSVFGLLYDKYGNPLYDADGSPVISNDNDFSSLLIGDDGKLYMVSHFENYDVGSMYITELSQDAQTGELGAIRTRHLDFSQLNGGWIHCAGSLTPWGTHLGSEEYEPDWTQVDPVTNRYTGWQSNGGSSANMASYFGGSAWYQDPDAFDYHVINWYDYGWQIEVKVHDFAHVNATKHYSMGRIAHELGYVLPDR